MQYKNLKLEKKDTGVLKVTLDHAENLNALGMEMSRELRAALEEAEADDSVRVVLLAGAGRAFSSGGDIREFRKSLQEDAAKYMDELTAEIYPAVQFVMDMQKPVVAAVHGFAYGAAMNLVMACDLAVAAEGTVFCESFLKLGLIPGGLATILLPRALGPKRAAEMCYTASETPAEVALRLGLVNAVVAKDRLEDEAMALAEKVAAAPPLAVRETKRLLREATKGPEDEQAGIERQTQIRMARTDDFKEGVMSFFEKRKPVFKGS